MGGLTDKLKAALEWGLVLPAQPVVALFLAGFVARVIERIAGAVVPAAGLAVVVVLESLIVALAVYFTILTALACRHRAEFRAFDLCCLAGQAAGFWLAVYLYLHMPR